MTVLPLVTMACAVIDASTESSVFKRLCVSLPDDVAIDLLVSNRNWLKIVRGDKITIRGKGYYCEGAGFYDYWDFCGGIDGSLIVRCGTRNAGAATTEGFVGTARETLDQQSSGADLQLDGIRASH